MSISLAANRLKPPPVPETPTVTRTRGAESLKDSAMASVIGNTVEEPSTLMFPRRLFRFDSLSAPMAKPAMDNDATKPIVENRNM